MNIASRISLFTLLTLCSIASSASADTLTAVSYTHLTLPTILRV